MLQVVVAVVVKFTTKLELKNERLCAWKPGKALLSTVSLTFKLKQKKLSACC
jgi:hypothetical protein